MTFDLVAGKVKEAMKGAGAGSSDLWKVPLENLHPIPGFNVRTEGSEHEAYIMELSDSIVVNGFLQNRPLAAFVDADNVIRITDGYCRLAATKMANTRGAEIKTLPVVVSPKGTSEEDLVVGLVTNNSGKPLSQYEIGLVCKRLIGYGWSTGDVAKRLAMTTQRVDSLLALVSAPAEVRKLVTEGKVSATQAIDTLKKHGPNAASTLKAGVERAKANGKDKATRKHIEEGKPTCRAVCKALVDWDETGRIDGRIARIIRMAKDAL